MALPLFDVRARFRSGAPSAADRLAPQRALEVARALRQAFADADLAAEVTRLDAAEAGTLDADGEQCVATRVDMASPESATPTNPGSQAAPAASDTVEVDLDVGLATPASSGPAPPADARVGSTRWAVSVGLSGGGGAYIESAGATVQIVNRDTGERADFLYGGLGAGIGLAFPGVGLGEPTPFETDRPVAFSDFEGTLVRLTSAELLGEIVGYGLQYISFPFLGANSIDVGGLTIGGLGASAGTTAGTMFAASPLPPPRPASVAADTRTATERRAFHLTLSFARGSERLDPDALTLIRGVADDMQVWARAGSADPAPASACE